MHLWSYFGALWLYVGPKLTPNGSILTLFELKCNFLTQLVHVSSKHIYMVLNTCNHAPMVIFWASWLYLRSKIDTKKVNFDTF